MNVRESPAIYYVIRGFPEIGINHPLLDRILHDINHPAMGETIDGDSHMQILDYCNPQYIG